MVRERRQRKLHGAHDQHDRPILRHSVHAADLDGDGDMDVLSASARSSATRLHGMRTMAVRTSRNCRRSSTTDDGVNERCLLRMWTGTATWMCSARRTYDDKIAWYENDGSGTLRRTRSALSANGALSVFALRTWTETATWTCSARRTMTARSLGTRTTAARTSRRTRSARRTIQLRGDQRVCGGRGRGRDLTSDVLSAWFERSHRTSSPR